MAMPCAAHRRETDAAKCHEKQCDAHPVLQDPLKENTQGAARRVKWHVATWRQQGVLHHVSGCSMKDYYEWKCQNLNSQPKSLCRNHHLINSLLL